MITLDIAQTRIDKKHGIGEITIVPESYTCLTEDAEFICHIEEHKNYISTVDRVLNTKYACTKCAVSKNADKLRKSLSTFIQESKDIHGENTFGYLNTIYINDETNIILTCSKHGDFEIAPFNHLRQKSGCDRCAGRKNSHQDFIEDAREIHSNKYEYPDDYKNPRSKINIFCNYCQTTFPQSPGDHLSGCGCPACATSGFDQSKPSIVYYFQDMVTCEYKFGISNKTIFKRFSKIYRNRIRLIKTWSFNSGNEAKKFEKEVHKSYNFYRTDNQSWRSLSKYNNGSTEFFFDDILNLDNNPLPIFGLNTLDLKTKI